MDFDLFLVNDLPDLPTFDSNALENENVEAVCVPQYAPGYLRSVLPAALPNDGEAYRKVLKEIRKYIRPKAIPWQGANYFADLPTSQHYTSVMSDMISDSIGRGKHSWIHSNAADDLEEIMLDWLAKMLGLPVEFHFCDSRGKETGGGGVIQGGLTTATSSTILASMQKALLHLDKEFPETSEGEDFSRMVAYCSDKVVSLYAPRITIRPVDSDLKRALQGRALEAAIERDREDGLFPIYVMVELGSGPGCFFDNLSEISKIAKRENLWLHVNAGSVGSAFACPEFRKSLTGIQNVDSFQFTPNKTMIQLFNGTCLWVKSLQDFSEVFGSKPAPFFPSRFLKHATPSYDHFKLVIDRRFLALQLWFNLRNFGVNGLQSVLRERHTNAKQLISYLRNDRRLDVVSERGSPLRGEVLFYVLGNRMLTELLLDKLMATHPVAMEIEETSDELVMIKVDIFEYPTLEDVDRLWKLIFSCMNKLLPDAKRRARLLM
ncbi:aromatic-L-amino-acid decarboxylase-like [Sycon ciliatum]|uniref:aromatic-L-amino-acid decarboxylase-like n=1 Tax=Sycon ciliatum TaxID=27933 RepID=UPI0031F62D6E